MELQGVTAERMAKGQGCGMEPQARCLGAPTGLPIFSYTWPQRWYSRIQVCWGSIQPGLSPIERVPQDRMADRRQVGPQLVGAASVGLEFQPAPERTGLQELPVGVSGFAGRVGAIKGWLAALAGQGKVNTSRWLGRHAEHIGPVGLVHQSLGEQLAQGPVQGRVEGQQHQARDVPIEPMHQLGRGPLLP
jgi:hypothetical protein